MRDEVHLAWFGNRGGAHTLLGHTGASTELLGRIVWHTDAPPHGSDLVGSFVAGYNLDGFYIVQLTRPDNTASRPGMVATTAAIVSVAQLAAFDLGALLALLSDAQVDSRAPLDITSTAPAGTHEHPPGASALASALLVGGRAAWVGPDFAEVVACLWRHISSADRARLVFGSAIHPEAVSVPTGSASIVAISVPGRVAARWSGWPIVSAESARLADPSRDALFRDDGGRAAALGRDLGLSDLEFAQWRHVAVAAALLAVIADLNHESTRALLQLLGLVQPAANEGLAPKQAALARLAQITPAAAYADIRGLRGVPWETLPPAPTLEDLLADWAHATLSDPLCGDAFADAAADAAAAESRDVFQTTLNSALQKAADRLTLSQAASAVLQHPRGHDATRWLIRHADSRGALDAALADAAASGAVPAWVMEVAAGHRLPCTHAVAVDTSDPVAAWRAQLGLAPRTTAAEDTLARRTGEVGTVQAAVRLGDAALADRAGRLVAAEPSLLTGGDAADDGYRTVWTAAIQRGTDPWAVVSPALAAGPLLALVADDQPVDAVLLDALSRTSAADLSHHPDRPRLWDRLPAEASLRFRATTAAAFARSLRPSDPPPEPQLQAAILAPDVLGPVAHDDSGQAVTVLRALPRAGAEHAVLVARRGRFTSGTAGDLGRLVLDRRWRRAAEVIADLASARPELQAAARQVGQLLNPLDRLLRLFDYTDRVSDLATADELRDALHVVAARLYSDGPTQGGLWERAGGDDADLPDAVTGRHRWGLALDAVLRGQRGAPELDALLAVMISDYPKNTELRILERGFQERKRK